MGEAQPNAQSWQEINIEAIWNDGTIKQVKSQAPKLELVQDLRCTQKDQKSS